MQSIAQIAFFKGATDLDLVRFERRCIWKKIDEGQSIVDFEDVSSDVYFLVSGDVRIQMRTPGGKEFILADLREGEFFGELSAIDGEPRSANVTALTKAVICIVGSALFREMLASSPMLAEKVMQLLARRIRDLNARLLEHTVLDIRHKLYAELLRLSVPRPLVWFRRRPSITNWPRALDADGNRSRASSVRWNAMDCYKKRVGRSFCRIPRRCGAGFGKPCWRPSNQESARRDSSRAARIFPLQTGGIQQTPETRSEQD